MTWLLAHDDVIKLLAAVPLLIWAGLAYWWSRDRPSLRDLGAMSVAGKNTAGQFTVAQKLHGVGHRERAARLSQQFRNPSLARN